MITGGRGKGLVTEMRDFSQSLLLLWLCVHVSMTYQTSLYVLNAPITNLQTVLTARCILFLIIWLITGGRHHFWFLPNLTADVGFIDSFRPLYTHEYKGPKADLKKEEKSESKKQQKYDSEEKSDSEKKEEEDGKTEATRNSGTEGSGGERHSDTDSDRREDDRSQHSSGNGNDFEMITKEELEQQTDEGDCEEEEEDDTESRPAQKS